MSARYAVHTFAVALLLGVNAAHATTVQEFFDAVSVNASPPANDNGAMLNESRIVSACVGTTIRSRQGHR